MRHPASPCRSEGRVRAPPYSCPKWGLGAEEICGTRDVSQAWGECIARSDIRVPEAKRGRVPL